MCLPCLLADGDSRQGEDVNVTTLAAVQEMGELKQERSVMLEYIQELAEKVSHRRYDPILLLTACFY